MEPSTGRPILGAQMATTSAAAPVARFTAYLLVWAPFVKRKLTPP